MKMGPKGCKGQGSLRTLSNGILSWLNRVLRSPKEAVKTGSKWGSKGSKIGKKA